MIAQEIGSFFIVLAVAVCVAGGIGLLYAVGLRLWLGGTVARGGEASGCPAGPTPGRRVGAIACFAACVLIVLFALWLMIPVFY